MTSTKFPVIGWLLPPTFVRKIFAVCPKICVFTWPHSRFCSDVIYGNHWSSKNTRKEELREDEEEQSTTDEVNGNILRRSSVRQRTESVMFYGARFGCSSEYGHGEEGSCNDREYRANLGAKIQKRSEIAKFVVKLQQAWLILRPRILV